MRRVIAPLLGFAIFLMSPAIPAQASEMTAQLLSPKIGTPINPDFPFQISLRITGGAAATATTCDQIDFEFGAQLIDAKNHGKALHWYVSNVGGRTTGDELYYWNTKIVSQGVECTVIVGGQTGQYSTSASFSEGLTTKDTEWFGTESSNWSGNTTNFGPAIKMDIAWNINNFIHHNIFEITYKGSPKVELKNLERGQTVDYQFGFQVVANLLSTQEISGIGANSDLGMTSDIVNCAGDALTNKLDLPDGTTTYTETCEINLLESDLNSFSAGISGYVSTDNLYAQTNPVAINIGKQGTPPCVSTFEELYTSLGEVRDLLLNHQSNWSLITTAKAAKTIKDSLVKIQKSLEEINKSSDSVIIEASICRDQQKNLTESANALAKSNLDFTQVVQKFINSPAEQAKAVAKVKANAKKVASEKAAYAKNMYNFGNKLVNSWSASELKQTYVWRFVSPGKTMLSTSQAKDWCAQLPLIVVGLPNLVGFPANVNFVNGCANAATKITFTSLRKLGSA